MKKFLFAAAVIGMSLSLNSCANSDDAMVEKKELNASFLGSGAREAFSADRRAPSGFVGSFEFTLGRVSKECAGFGVCGLVVFSIDIIDLPPTSAPKSTPLVGDIIQNPNNEFSALIYLNQNVDPNQYDTVFYIDQDFNAGENYLLKAGEYQLDNSIGEYGGYKIIVEQL
nr:hypothetical protein [uncultured Chryseobacterium sp.]